MKAREVPPMYKALTDLEPYFPLFYDAFEAATDNSKNYFEDHTDPHDPYLHAHLVRHYVSRYLVKHNLNAQEYGQEQLANSGIQLLISPWFIRVKKSLRGAVPVPGSKKQQKYYQQELPKEFSEVYNLLLLWHANFKGDFQSISLIYPLAPDLAKWRAEIPHPALSKDIQATEQVGFNEIGDLDIEPLEEDDDDLEADGQ